MYQVDASALHKATSILSLLIRSVEGSPAPPPHAPMGRQAADSSIAMLGRLEAVVAPLSVPVSKLTIRDTKSALRDMPEMTYFGCAQMLLSISKTLERELETVKVFSIDARRVGFYEPSEPPFGAEVAAKFPSLSGELDQAGKCFACDLPTAAAFHWVRCLEAGVRAVCRCLGIPDPTKGAQRNWSSIAREITKAMEAKWPTATDKDTDEAKRFAKYLACLTTFTNPYRNETMHFDAVYTATEAQHLYELVKGLMSQIASRMNEDGLPSVP